MQGYKTSLLMYYYTYCVATHETFCINCHDCEESVPWHPY